MSRKLIAEFGYKKAAIQDAIEVLHEHQARGATHAIVRVRYEELERFERAASPPGGREPKGD